MQIETTTITTEQQTVLGANFQITVIEQEITAFCDTCANNSTGSKQTLENRGWYLGSREQFCPHCNF